MLVHALPLGLAAPPKHAPPTWLAMLNVIVLSQPVGGISRVSEKLGALVEEHGLSPTDIPPFMALNFFALSEVVMAYIGVVIWE